MYWKHYVDDSFSITKRNALITSNQTLNTISLNMSFTVQHKETDESLASTLEFQEQMEQLLLTFTETDEHRPLLKFPFPSQHKTQCYS